ncbi:MAG: STAS domain-containing protein [Anaerolineae bacterium]|nr:STAS domain-containing protein [Anaerolineae bacterium]
MEMDISHPSDSTLVLNIRGRFDAYMVDKVKSSWQSRPDIKNIVVDLSETTFIDSMGLATLISGLKEARRRGGILLVANPAEMVQVILGLTAMDRALTIVPTVEEALSQVTDV